MTKLKKWGPTIITACAGIEPNHLARARCCLTRPCSLQPSSSSPTPCAQSFLTPTSTCAASPSSPATNASTLATQARTSPPANSCALGMNSRVTLRTCLPRFIQVSVVTSSPTPFVRYFISNQSLSTGQYAGVTCPTDSWCCSLPPPPIHRDTFKPVAFRGAYPPNPLLPRLSIPLVPSVNAIQVPGPR